MLLPTAPPTQPGPEAFEPVALQAWVVGIILTILPSLVERVEAYARLSLEGLLARDEASIWGLHHRRSPHAPCSARAGVEDSSARQSIAGIRRRRTLGCASWRAAISPAGASAARGPSELLRGSGHASSTVAGGLSGRDCGWEPIAVRAASPGCTPPETRDARHCRRVATRQAG